MTTGNISYVLFCTNEDKIAFEAMCADAEVSIHYLAAVSIERLIDFILRKPENAAYLIMEKKDTAKMQLLTRRDVVPHFVEFDPRLKRIKEISDENPSVHDLQAVLQVSMANEILQVQEKLGLDSASDVIRQAIHTQIEFTRLLATSPSMRYFITSKEKAAMLSKRLKAQNRRH